MSVHGVKERIACQAIHPVSSGRRVVGSGTAIAADYVVTGISRVRRVVDSELRVVEDIKRFGSEFEIPFTKNLEVFQQGKIEIYAVGIVDRIAS